MRKKDNIYHLIYHLRSSSGFAIIELILYLSLVAFLLLILSIFLMQIINSAVKSRIIEEVEQQGSYLLQHILQNIRNADGIMEPLIGEEGNRLELKVKDQSKDPTIYDVFGGILRIKEGSTLERPLISSRVYITNLVFKNLSRPATPGNIRVEFTIKYAGERQRKEYIFSQNFYGTASLRPPK